MLLCILPIRSHLEGVLIMKTEQKILEMLKETPEDFVSGEDVSMHCGYIIESATGSGYRLKKTPNMLLPAEIKRSFKTGFVGRQIPFR